MPRNDAQPTLELSLRVPIMHTERLLLRPHRMADAERWHEMQSSPQVSQYTAWPQRTRRSALRQLKRRTRQTQLHRVDDVLDVAIERDGELVGEVSLQLRSLPAYARAHIHALLLVAVVHPANAASVALAHKLKLHPLPGTADRTVFVGRNGPLAVVAP